MSDVVTYNVGLGVALGPTLAENGHFDAEAYEKIDEVTIPKGSVAKTVNVQPSALTEMQALCILSSNYTDLTYTVDDGVDVHTLSGPLILIGPGNIALLGASVLDLVFTNSNAETDALITILVARTAVEPPGN